MTQNRKRCKTQLETLTKALKCVGTKLHPCLPPQTVLSLHVPPAAAQVLTFYASRIHSSGCWIGFRTRCGTTMLRCARA